MSEMPDSFYETSEPLHLVEDSYENPGVLATRKAFEMLEQTTEHAEDTAPEGEVKTETSEEFGKRIRQSIGGTNVGIGRPKQRGRYKDYRN